MNANQTHPIITFQLAVQNRLSEKIGPNTNQKDVPVLHPDRYGNTGYLQAIPEQLRMLLQDYYRTTWLPGLTGGENFSHNMLESTGAITFTLTGSKATYVKNMYTTGDNAYLTVVSETWASEADAPNV